MSFVEKGLKKLKEKFDSKDYIEGDELIDIEDGSLEILENVVKSIGGKVQDLQYICNSPDGLYNKISLQGGIKIIFDKQNKRLRVSNSFAKIKVNFYDWVVGKYVPQDINFCNITIYSYKGYDALKIVVTFGTKEWTNFFEIVVADKQLSNCALHVIDERYH